MSAAGSWSAASLSFGEGLDATLRRRSISAALEWRPLSDVTLTAAAGAAIDGDLTVEERHEIGPGPLGSLGVGWRIVEGEGWIPFVLLSGAASASSAITFGPHPDARLTAVDLRASLTVGELFADRLAPYLALRGFGGPIFWRHRGDEVVGSDRQHFQLGGGMIVSAAPLDAFLEIMPLGERNLTFGIGASF